MSARLADALRTKAVLSALVASGGWKVLCEVIDEQIHNRRQEHELKPLESLDAVPKAEYAKGELGALQLVKRLPHAMIDSSQSVIDAEKTEEEENGEIEEVG